MYVCTSMKIKSKRSKATDIPQKVKKAVWNRDGQRCIFCGSPYAMPNAHYIPRSKGGLGIEQNIVTACAECHFKMDSTKDRKWYLLQTKKYLERCYPNWNEKDLVYEKN